MASERFMAGRFCDAIFAAASSVLAVQADRPLWGQLSISPLLVLINYGAAFGLVLGTIRGLLGPRSDHRFSALLVSFALTYLVVQLDAWSLSTAGRLSTTLAASFSFSWHGLPWLALLVALALSALGFLQYSALIRLSARWPVRLCTAIAGLIAGITTCFWLRALLGYASGSPSLLPF